MQTFTDFIRYLKFTDGLSSSDIIGWLLAALAGIIAYKLIDHMQTAIERHSMLSAAEDDITKIYNSVTAISMQDGDKLPENGKICKKDKVMVRSVLHDYTDWNLIKNNANKIECRIIENQRYLHIRNGKGYNEWISTQALHEINLKVRRLEKMFKGGVLKRVDLADMFRELVPLGTNGRIEFYQAYYGDYDAECIGYLVMQTIVSCYKYKNTKIVDSFTKYYIKHPEIHNLFIKSRRIRPLADLFAVYKFKKIVSNS